MLSKIGSFLRKNPVLIVVVLAGFLLRSFATESTPPSLNWDEVSHGYNAFSILTTGKDEWGKTLPLIFRVFGDYKLPVYIYITAISESVFGLTSFAVRLPSILAGASLILLTYLLTIEIFHNKKYAYIAAVLVAVEPWSLFLSRGAFEANLATAFFLLGVYLFMVGVKRSRPALLTSIVAFGLTVWTYNSFRIFTPLMLCVLVFLYRKEILRNIWVDKNFSIRAATIFLVMFLPMLWQLLMPVGQVRYGKVAIVDAGAIAQIENSRNSSPYPAVLSRLLFNRVTFFWKGFLANWISHYSGDFLFFRGGTNYQFSVPGWGLIYLIELPTVILGLACLIKKRTKEAVLLLLWFYFAPIPSSITREAPHVLRSITMLPMPMIFSAVGLVVISDWLKKRFKFPQKLAYILFFVTIAFLLKGYLTSYFGSYRETYSWSWQYGYKQVVAYAKVNYSKYDKILITKRYGEPYEYVLFYWPVNSNDYQNDPNLVRFYKSNWYWVDSFDKFYFLNDWEISSKSSWSIPRSLDDENVFKLESGGEVNCHTSSAKCLLVTSPGNVPNNWKKLETISFLNKQPAFEMYSN
jgi:4-amino-4-deoxy-L-arabinose transferase-like glycosyltransferase